MDESTNPPLKLQFDWRVHLEFRGAHPPGEPGGLARLNNKWVQKGMAHTTHRRIILDMVARRALCMANKKGPPTMGISAASVITRSSCSISLGELLPRVGFIVTNMTARPEAMVHFYNGRGRRSSGSRQTLGEAATLGKKVLHLRHRRNGGDREVHGDLRGRQCHGSSWVRSRTLTSSTPLGTTLVAPSVAAISGCTCVPRLETRM